MMHSPLKYVSLAALPLLFACPGPSEGEEYPDLGPIETTVDEVARTVWPGVVTESGLRHVRLVNGFWNGETTAYWFAGFASRLAPDVFLFCEEGDSLCPFDDTGAVTWDRLVGDPVFARIPGEEGFSPYWLAWRVDVPKSYKANDLKSVQGIQNAEKDGEITVEAVIFDHGGDIGPAMTLMHCLLVLEGTELEGNGGDSFTEPGKKSLFVEPRKGWHKQYSLNFFDYTASAGVFPPHESSESVPMMPTADIFVFFRDCANGSDSDSCLTTSAENGAVSERGIEEDLTNDDDKADNNNIISGFPRMDSGNPLDKIYSPLWQVFQVMIPPENDDQVVLIDTTGDQNDTMVKSSDDVRSLVDQGLVREPKALDEEFAGNQIHGNDGFLFFNCPSQVPE